MENTSLDCRSSVIKNHREHELQVGFRLQGMFMEGVWRCVGFARAKDLVRTLLAIFHMDAKFGFWVADNIFEGRGDGGF